MVSIGVAATAAAVPAQAAAKTCARSKALSHRLARPPFPRASAARLAQGRVWAEVCGQIEHDYRTERDPTPIRWVHRELRPAIVVAPSSGARARTCACVYSLDSLTLTAGMRTCSGKPLKKPCSAEGGAVQGCTVATPRAARRLAAVGLANGPTQDAGGAVAEPPAAPHGHAHTQHTKSVTRTAMARRGRILYHCTRCAAFVPRAPQGATGRRVGRLYFLHYSPFPQIRRELDVWSRFVGN